MRKVVIVTSMALVLIACAQQPKTVWLRVDGQRGAGNPVLSQQYEMDRTICTAAAGQVERGCMAEKGYVLVNEEDAAAKAAELRAIDAEKKRQAVASSAPLSRGKK
jgi:hypothetical protein